MDANGFAFNIFGALIGFPSEPNLPPNPCIGVAPPPRAARGGGATPMQGLGGRFGSLGKPIRAPNMLKANPLASMLIPYNPPHAPRPRTDQHNRRGPRRQPAAHSRRLFEARGPRGQAG